MSKEIIANNIKNLKTILSSLDFESDLYKSLSQTILELTRAKSEGWYCQNCKVAVDPKDVTYYERHESCGTYIGEMG